MDTWKERSMPLLERVSPEGREILRKATAPIREGERVEAAFEAAKRWAEEVIHSSAFASFDAACLCWLEAKGLYGGGPHCPGASTRRHPAFINLGSGRRQAGDGQAWTAAIAAAARMWLSTLPAPRPHSLEWGSQDGNLGVSRHDGRGQAVQFISLSMLLASEPEALLNATLHAARESYHYPDCWGKLAPAIGNTLDLARELLAKQK